MVRRITSPVKKPKKRKYTRRTSRNSRSYTSRRKRKSGSKKLHPPGYFRQTFDNLLGTYGLYGQTGELPVDVGRDFSFKEPETSDTSDEEDSLPTYEGPLIPYRPIHLEDFPIYAPPLDRTPLTREEMSRRERLEEGIFRIAEWRRQEKEEYDMLAEEAMALYPGRGERLKLLRSNYIRNELQRREEEAEMREEERLRSLRRRRPPSSGLRSSRRTSPRRRDAFDTLAGGVSSIANLMHRAGDYISSGFTSLRRTSPLRRESSTGSAKPSKEKVESAAKKIPFRRTSPRKRKNPKKKTRIVELEDP